MSTLQATAREKSKVSADQWRRMEEMLAEISQTNTG